MDLIKNNNNVDSAFKSPVVLSLCSGMCGIERGIERAIGKIRVAAYVEIEAFIIENLVSLMEKGLLDSAPIWANLKTFIPEPFHRKIHGIIGGYPCQPFSQAGKRKGAEDPRHLWPYIHKPVGTIRPVWCFFENVIGHITMGFDQVYKDLSDLGYSVEAGIYSAEEAGAPHQRKRLFILAIDKLAFPESFRQTSGFNEIFPTKGRLNALSKFTAGNSNELVNTKGRRSGELQNQIETGQGHGVTGPSRISGGSRGGGVAYTPELGIQGNGPKRFQITETHVGPEIFMCNGRRKRWPARPGQEQYDWEAARLISNMGCTINGYNFREDLLRMEGNGVVEQTAEIAFLDLLKKHGIFL